MTIRSTAPGKLILLGEHAVVYGHPCIITAVGQAIHAEVAVNNTSEDLVIAPQVAKTDFIDELVKYMKKKYNIQQGIRIETHADFSDQTGLGSSSAATVVACKGINALFNLGLSQQEIFNICFETVVMVQGSGSGADIASAVYEGTVYFQNKGEIVESVNCSDLQIVIGNTLHKASTRDYIQKVAKLREEKPHFVDSIFQGIAELVHQGRKQLEEKNYQKFGNIVNENQSLLHELEVSSDKLDSMIHAAREAGAFGAKLSGAGGGDNMFAVVSADTKKSVEKAIEKAGGKIIHVDINYSSQNPLS